MRNLFLIFFVFKTSLFCGDLYNKKITYIFSNLENTLIPKTHELLTLGQIYENKNNLNGTVIKFNAKVIKIGTSRIDGIKWLRLSDDTSIEKPIFVAAYTLDDYLPSEGDIVNVEGFLDIDVDMGQGYFYPMIVREATFNTLK